MLRNLFVLGKSKSTTIINLLYGVGMIPVVYKAYLVGVKFYQSRITDVVRYDNAIKEIGSYPLGITAGIITFFVLLVFWKSFCELLLVMFRYFESNSNIGKE